MKNNRFFLIAILFLPFFASNIFAQGWPQPKGHGFFKLDFSFIRARSYYGPDGNIYDLNGAGTLLGNYTTAFYGEYGITNKLTVISYIPFLVRNTVNEGVGAITGEVLQPGLENTAFGDVDLGFRYGFLKKGGFVLSGSAWLGIPSGDYENADLLYTGDGEWNQQIRVEWGYGAARWYTNGFAGLNNRTKGFSEEFRFQVEAGYWLVRSKLLASAKFAGVQSFFNGNPDGTTNGLFANNVEFLSPQLGLTWEQNGHWGITTLIAGAFSGTNALAAPSVSAGVYWKLKK
ncbi:MAG: hypothetical protein OHK0019_32940 [Saprospiraceae bacterium]